MKYNRWYDRKENLRTIVESLQSLDSSARNAFALDIIQSAIEKQSDKDTFLEILNDKISTDGKRWYDDNDVVQSAIEMFNFLPDDEIEELFKETVISIMYENEDISRQ